MKFGEFKSLEVKSGRVKYISQQKTSQPSKKLRKKSNFSKKDYNIKNLDKIAKDSLPKKINLKKPS